MAVIIKTKEQIETLREGGKRLAGILEKVADRVVPGITTQELNDYAEQLVRERGGTPAFLNYQPEGATFPYPASLCVSINDEIVHGIPGDRKLEEGDIITVDLGLKHGGLFTDHAITVPVGKVSPDQKKLIHLTREALAVGVKVAQPGNTIGDIGNAIESFVDGRYGIVRDLAGHGVGVHIHEDPYVPNYGEAGQGEVLQPGMVLAIEPMLTLGSENIMTNEDGYTIQTDDGSIAAHFEHTVLITENGPEILTKV